MDLSNTKVLVIDKDDRTKNQLCQFLLKSGVLEDSLICCESTSEAMIIIESMGADLDMIFIEAKIKETDGYSVCSVINKCEELKIPFYILAYLDEFGPIRALSIRMQGFLKKPINFFALQAHIERWQELKSLEKKLFDVNFNLECACNGRRSN